MELEFSLSDGKGVSVKIALSISRVRHGRFQFSNNKFMSSMEVGSGETGLLPQPPVRRVESKVLSEHSQGNSKALLLVLSFFQENINPLSWSLVHSASLDQCEQGMS